MLVASLQEQLAKQSWLPAQLAKRLFLRLCASMQTGMLAIEDGDERYHFGMPEVCGATPVELHHRVSIRVKSDRFYCMVVTGGANGAAEAYMEGLWETSDLVTLVRFLLANRAQLDAMESGVSAVLGTVSRGWHALNRNTVAGSKRNIAAHYDLGNEFFRLFLDERLMYSSAIYPTSKETLAEASELKLQRICRKLDLQPDDHLLEIGTGWGGMAIYAAQKYGCRVTTTTISKEQFNEASARVAAAGLQDRITLLLEDYRDLKGQYDKLVSIEMVEAVGHQYLDTYFAQISHLLKPEGLAVIQAITIDDQRYVTALKEVDFIKRFIFPGSFIPCVTVLANSGAKAGLRVFNLEDIGPSYALTLRDWRQRFMTRLDEVRAQGFDERFIRMWEFYLCYCEGGFRERAISTVQLIFTRSGNRRDQWL
jgi:cyclopropane-fatty-acyl-phospholipid synthase